MIVINHRSKYFLFFVITFGLGLIYFYSVSYFFIFDDTSIVTKGAQLSIGKIVSQPLAGFYRPACFILAKIEYLLFGWQYPGGYSIVTILAHCASTLIFYYLLLEFGFDATAATISSLLFLASAWAAETIFWMSCQFDIFSVLFGLSSSLLLAIFIRNKNNSILIISVLLYITALLFKENAIIFSFLLIIIITLRLRDNCLSSFRESIITFSPFILATVLYLMFRSIILPNFNGAYGNISTLYQQANIIENIKLYLETLLFLNNSKFFYRIQILSCFYTIGAIILLLIAIRKPKIYIILLILFFFSIMPVIWAPVNPETTAGGRLLYAPGLLWSAFLGLGASELINYCAKLKKIINRKIGRFLAFSSVFILILVVFASTISQIRLWRFSTELARNIIDYTFSLPYDSHLYIHITNLPSGTIQGPYLLKSYNLIHHMWGTGRKFNGHISAETVLISVFDPDINLPNGPDIFGIHRTHRNEFEVSLPLEKLRTTIKNLSP